MKLLIACCSHIEVFPDRFVLSGYFHLQKMCVQGFPQREFAEAVTLGTSAVKFRVVG
jgi:hypothetical protein